LSASEAARRLHAEGPNALPAERDHRLLRLILGVLAEPMIVLLCVAVALYVVLGDLREALVLAASLIAVVAITVVQERRTGRALAALRDLSSPRAAVVRDGELQRIPGREVVRGDIVLLSEGDRVPADGLLRESITLAVDESLLTGESVPVPKQADPERAEMSRPHADSHTCVYSGTLVVQGHGTAEIMATGATTEVGRIGHALTVPQPKGTPLYRETRRLVQWLALFGVMLCLAVVLLYASLRGDWVAGALAGITLAMSILPEEFPVVLTVFLAIGAWRLSKHNVLTRSMPAIETLGAATVLAVDKTGTLTENRMAVAVLDDGARRITLSDASGNVDDRMRDLLSTALAACEIDAFDPMERAIVTAAKRHAPDAVRRLSDMTLVHEYELTPQLPAVTHVWKRNDEVNLRVAAKGAPEALAAVCGLEPDAAARVLQRTEELASDGLRVLAVADSEFAGKEFPPSPHGLALRFRGLIGLRDPVREGVPAALDECRGAGIRVIMITGDHAATARSVARAVGLDDSSGMLTGAQLATLDDAGLRETVRGVNVYARTPPDEKLRLVRALRANGDIVAMTGDGVNDAPALKAADIGVAMGITGTEVSKEAAVMILTDDNFATIVKAVEQGRALYDNLMRYIRFQMASLFGFISTFLGASIFNILGGVPFLPLQTLWINFTVTVFQAVGLGYSKPRTGLMEEAPRPKDAQILPRPLFLWLAFVGLIFAAVTLPIIVWAGATYDERIAHTMGLVTFSLLHVWFSLETFDQERTIFSSQLLENPTLLKASGLSLLTIFLATTFGPLQRVLDTTELGVDLWAICIVASTSIILVTEVAKVFRRRSRGQVAQAPVGSPALGGQPS
jgi:Ca2+-transporting ATPase